MNHFLVIVGETTIPCAWKTSPRGAGSRVDSVASTARVLIIAGSDSGGGAGIQADIKTIAMLGGHPMTAVTAVTAQNTLGVEAIHPIPAEMILAQMDAVISDIGVDAVKIGMIGSAFAAKQVAARLQELKSTAAGHSNCLRPRDGRDERLRPCGRCDDLGLRQADGRRDHRHAEPAGAQAPHLRRKTPSLQRCIWSGSMAVRC